MTSRRERKNRDWILQQAQHNPASLIELKGYLNLNKDSNWITFTQIENNAGERVTGHINLPKNKISKLFPNFREFNHKPFLIIGKPDSYVNKGTKRGCIKVEQIKIID